MNASLVTISTQQCEALFSGAVDNLDGQRIGADSVLPVTPTINAEFVAAAKSFVQRNQPWWVYLADTADGLCAMLFVERDLPVFAGHFPGNALLPGVLQIDWALTAAETFAGAPATEFSGMSGVKFKAPVRPATWLKLTLARRGSSLAFSFTDSGGVCTEGKLKYGE
jgi:hypothetical protein